jgi:L-lysine exporter family protein LysE/ArgO
MIAFIPGFLAGLSLIIAIGAQNAFVIKQGLTKKHVLLTVAICAVADALLIALGAAGLGRILQSLPTLLEAIRWLGVAYLTWFGIKSVRSVFQSEVMGTSTSESASAKKVAKTVLGFTFLNPHVYLDTVILLGSISNQFKENRWFFSFGAMLASLIWFTSIGYGAKAASRFMSKPIFWKILDSIIACVMFSIAGYLAFATL